MSQLCIQPTESCPRKMTGVLKKRLGGAPEAHLVEHTATCIEAESLGAQVQPPPHPNPPFLSIFSSSVLEQGQNAKENKNKNVLGLV